MKSKFTTPMFSLWLGVSLSANAQRFSARELVDRSIRRRAVEAVIWGMPAVNYERMLQAAGDNGAKLNQVVQTEPAHAGVARNPAGPDLPFDPIKKKRVHRGGSFLCTISIARVTWWARAARARPARAATTLDSGV